MSDYTHGHWAAEVSALHVLGAMPPACPRCSLRGFFGPRHDGNARMYRLCKFCGFYQEVGGAPMMHRATAHSCPQWPTVLGAPYVWWTSETESSYTCDRCGDAVDVKAHTITRPVDDASHPWRGVSQSLTAPEALAFWRKHGHDRYHL